MVRSESGKVYVKQSYWEKTPVKHVKQLPYIVLGKPFLMFRLMWKRALNPRGMVDLGQT